MPNNRVCPIVRKIHCIANMYWKRFTKCDVQGHLMSWRQGKMACYVLDVGESLFFLEDIKEKNTTTTLESKQHQNADVHKWRLKEPLQNAKSFVSRSCSKWALAGRAFTPFHRNTWNTWKWNLCWVEVLPNINAAREDGSLCKRRNALAFVARVLKVYQKGGSDWLTSDKPPGWGSV